MTSTIVTTAVYPEQAETADFNWSARFSWHDGDVFLRGDGATEQAAVLDLLTNSEEYDEFDGSVFEHIADMALQHWVASQTTQSVSEAAKVLLDDIRFLAAFCKELRSHYAGHVHIFPDEIKEVLRALAKEGE